MRHKNGERKNQMVALLLKTEIFKGLHPEALEAMLKETKGKIKNFKAGEILDEDFWRGRYLGIMLSGVAAAKKYSQGGQDIFLKDFMPGDVFGMGALFSQNKGHNSVIEAREDVSCLFLSQKEMEVLLSQNERVLRNYLRFLSEKVDFLNERIEIFTQDSAKERLLLFLTMVQEKNHFKSPFCIYHSKAEIAHILGISRASLYRSIEALHEEKRLLWQGNKVYLEIERKI